jgi:hypothetical protein
MWSNKMKKAQSPVSNQPNYWQLTCELIDQYAPTALHACKTHRWPDELVDRDLVICDRTTGERVAKISFGDPNDPAHILIPQDYVQPMLREPFSTIDDEEKLPPAGELLCEIIELIDYIITSPHGELTNKRRLSSLVEELHQKHDYSPEIIQTQIVQEAQRRGDLPNAHD